MDRKEKEMERNIGLVGLCLANLALFHQSILLTCEELALVGFFTALRTLLSAIFQGFNRMKVQKHGGKVFLAAKSTDLLE